jgi:flagellar assembly factor FliW
MTMTPTSENVITFAEGLPGFESCRRFVLMSSSTLAPFTVVQGLDGASPPSFVAIDPQVVARDYSAMLAGLDLARLGAESGHPLLWLALVAPRPDGTVTVNLRAPIVINPASMRGIQLVSADAAYPLEYPLAAA